MRHLFWLTLLYGLLCGACSLQAPEIKVTGERSLLEKQVLGSYQSFSRDQWMVTSLRGLPDSLAPEDERENLLKAIRRRRFNQDDRLRLLAAGWLGEGLDGRLSLRGEAAPAPEEAELRERVLRQENLDREALLGRLQRLYPGQEAAELAAIFAAIQRDEAPKGAWLQRMDGGWERK